MARKKIELNETTQTLVTKYIEDTGIDFNELANKALKDYIVNKLTPNEVKAALKNYYENQGIDPTPFIGEIPECHHDHGDRCGCGSCE